MYTAADLAPNASEASNQLRRSPNSSDEVFVSLGTGIKSATRVWRCCGGCQLFVVIDEEEKRRGRIFLGRVDEVETELELAESQATNKASSRGGEAPTHRAQNCPFEVPLDNLSPHLFLPSSILFGFPITALS